MNTPSGDRSRNQGMTAARGSLPDVVCLSHLRWNFVFQRPQHLMSRLSAAQRVFFVEEPVWEDRATPELVLRHEEPGVMVAVPHLPRTFAGDGEPAAGAQRLLLDRLLASHQVRWPILWYYTPMALAFSGHLRSRLVVYDCMDELSAFAGAPPELRAREDRLFARADLVFTGGRSLYEAKRERHAHVHLFPSSVDVAHFRQARAIAGSAEPEDQRPIPRPRLGFAGVIDERMDLDLIDGVARERPDWHLVMLGPVVKIDPRTLPRRPNIHFLGMKSYQALPAYLAGWQVALLPFARNEATRFISPTKTPEYLAAGRPVVSTSIRDVVNPYGLTGLVRIADTVPEFVSAVAMELGRSRRRRQAQADRFLERRSWERTVAEMRQLMSNALAARAESLDVEVAAPRSATA
jgi:glycosyltransferase involved in cell wall biosynthesis